MSDTPTETTVGFPRATKSPAIPDDLAHHLHDVVLDTPGVATLVPTMATALGRLHRRRARPNPSTPGDEHPPDTSTDGVSVTVDQDAVTAVIDITVASTASVLTTAMAVRSAAVTALQREQASAYTVKVNVLGLEPDPHVEP